MGGGGGVLTQKIPVATPKSVNWDWFFWDFFGFLNFRIGIALGFFGFFGIVIFWGFWDFLGFLNFQIGIGFSWDWDFLGFLNFQIGIGFFVFFGMGILLGFFGFFGFFWGFLFLYFLNLKLVLVFLFFDDYLWKYSQQSACQCLK